MFWTTREVAGTSEEIRVRCVLKGSPCSAVKVSSERGEVTIDPRACLQCELIRRGEKLPVPVFVVQPPHLPAARMLPEILPAKPPLGISTR
ncbi:MAG: hypothetical protein KIH01_01225 [Candidatus Freyarchaeota archaeon]|nr:hypothetical protein [Candidatus Jordarchaeia archaeon]